MCRNVFSAPKVFLIQKLQKNVLNFLCDVNCCDVYYNLPDIV